MFPDLEISELIENLKTKVEKVQSRNKFLTRQEAGRGENDYIEMFSTQYTGPVTPNSFLK